MVQLRLGVRQSAFRAIRIAPRLRRSIHRPMRF